MCILYHTETSSDIHMKQFCEACKLKNLIKKPTCFKKIDNPSGIDFILKKHYKYFQDLGTFNVWLP